MRATLPQKLFSELLGTALLLAVVIGSGIMGERLSAGDLAIALLANTLATVGGLYVLIEVFGPIGGAHFNPAVSLTMAWRGNLPWSMLGPYVACQLLGAVLGAWLAHAMFDVTILQFSTKVRAGAGQWIAEAVATFGLLLVILRAPAARVAACERRMLISGGENNYPAEIENLLMTHPAVADGVTMGVSDASWGEPVKACVFLRPGMQADEREIIDWMRERLAHFVAPEAAEQQLRNVAPRYLARHWLRRGEPKTALLAHHSMNARLRSLR